MIELKRLYEWLVSLPKPFNNLIHQLTPVLLLQKMRKGTASDRKAQGLLWIDLKCIDRFLHPGGGVSY